MQGVQPGQELLLDDGKLLARVDTAEPEALVCTVVQMCIRDRCAHSVDDGLETGILQLLCGAGLTHAQVHTGVADRVDQVLCGAAHLLLAGRYAGNVQLAAQSGGLFKQGHVMAAQRCHTGGFQTGRAAAEDGDLLFLRCGLDAAGVLVAVLRVQHAGEELTVLDGIGAALVATDAAADIAEMCIRDRRCTPASTCPSVLCPA